MYSVAVYEFMNEAGLTTEEDFLWKLFGFRFLFKIGEILKIELYNKEKETPVEAKFEGKILSREYNS